MIEPVEATPYAWECWCGNQNPYPSGHCLKCREPRHRGRFLYAPVPEASAPWKVALCALFLVASLASLGLPLLLAGIGLFLLVSIAASVGKMARH